MSTDALSQLSREELIALAERERETFALQAESQAETIRRLEQQQETLATKLELQTQTIQELQRKREQLEHRLALALKQLYGQRRERFVSPDQLMLFSVEDIEQLAQEAEAELRAQQQEKLLARRRGKKQVGHGRRPLPEHLPREVIRHELSAEERSCPCCGEARAEIGCESSEQLEFIPASFKVLVHERVKYACRACQENVAIAPPASKPIEKGLPGPGLLAQTVLSKYGDHLPLYRQEDIVARSGIVLRRSTLCDWIAAAAVLLTPLYRRMCELVLASRVLYTDDTTVSLLDPLACKAKQARFWAYLGDDQHPHVVYDFTESRKRDGPAKFLTGFAGYLHADAYGGYDGIYAGGGAIEVACWAHARRKWFEARKTDPARAHHALALIQKLYHIERDARRASDEERHAARQEHSLPILAEFKTWLDAEREQLLPKSPIGQAATYTFNQWTALTRYCESGELKIDNNAAERTMRPVAIGRKNWLFVASRTGGERAAVLMSVVQTCKRNQVEPWAYLRDVFEQLPSLGENPTRENLDQLLPNQWLKANPNHVWRIQQLREQDDA
ncbi:IS66-like element ISBlma9 family transposase [Blastopirellula marina]|uniref:Transposase n=1 Tax=Blastopirellula marina DSM 3645 TaxID=314230 RepID=A3ZP54_9BACT|nr:IS66-like element ISBlma9 family transposase [Blastopirellula marina]EAQ81528.1 hypothetical protein DSM3645_28142 [Blastopirellula marina DSM 3645]